MSNKLLKFNPLKDILQGIMVEVFRKYNLPILLMCLTISLKGQDMQNYAPQVPTSPQAESFGKYGDIEINPSTGIPNISIPLYEINHRGYKLPLILKYNPQPLKPGYNHDVYGLGWGLSVNSCISRTIEYVPDEWRNFNIESDILNSYYYLAYGLPSNICGERSGTIFNTTDNRNLAHDKFHAVLPDGNSFDFIIDEGKVFHISDKRNVKLDCNYSEANINSFTVTDENGVIYTFSGADTPYNGSHVEFNNSFVSWQLTQIKLPYSTQTINFTYNLTIKTSSVNTNYEEPECVVKHINGCAGGATSIQVTEYIPNYYKMMLLTSINYGSKSIIFSYANNNVSESPEHNSVNKISIYESNSLLKQISLDITNNDVLSFNGIITIALLNKISIHGSNPSELPQEYKCDYTALGTSYYGTDHWGYLTKYNTSKTVANFNFFVDKEIQYPEQSYISETNTTSEEINPFVKYKLATTSNLNHRKPWIPAGVLSKLIYPTGGYTTFEFENHKFLTSTDNNGNYILNYENKVPTDAAGFRIKKITNYLQNDVFSDCKNYRYGSNYPEDSGYDPNLHTGLGVAVVDPNILTYMSYTSYNSPYPIINMILGLDENLERNPFYANPFYTDNACNYGFYTCYTWECLFSASNFRRILGGRPAVLYSEVTVYYGEINEGANFTPEKTIGKTVYKYNLVHETLDLLGKMSADVFFEWLRYNGKSISVYNPSKHLYNNLKEQVDYEFNGVAFTPVKKTNFGYTSLTYSTTEYEDSHNMPLNYYPANTMLNSVIYSKTYTLGISRLTGKSVKLYHPNGEVTTTENYGYNENDQLTTNEVTNSNGDEIKTTYRYVFDTDFDDLGYGYPETNNMAKSIETMRDKHIIANPIETIKDVNGNIVEGTIVEYDLNQTAQLCLPYKVFNIETNSPISSFTESYLSDDFDFIKDESYKLNAIIDQYDVNGNILQYHKLNGNNTSYIWGYNDTYPIAKAENCTYANLVSAIQSARKQVFTNNYENLDDFLGAVSGLDHEYKLNGWANFISDVQSYLPNAMVTLYTYIPLVGMNSMTDLNGKTTYYIYDSFGRLYQVLDNSRNVLKQNTYHYANQ